MNQPNPYEAPTAFIEEEPYMDEQSWALPPLATRGSRLAASILDGLILAVPVMIFGIIYATLFSGSLSPSSGPESFLPIIAIPLLAVGGYNLHLLNKNGQTLGKKIMQIKIVRSDRRSRAGLARIVFARYLPQYVVQAIPVIGGMLSLVDVLFIFGDTRQCVHDRIADTAVIADDGLGDLTSQDNTW